VVHHHAHLLPARAAQHGRLGLRPRAPGRGSRSAARPGRNAAWAQPNLCHSLRPCSNAAPFPRPAAAAAAGCWMSDATAAHLPLPPSPCCCCCLTSSRLEVADMWKAWRSSGKASRASTASSPGRLRRAACATTHANIVRVPLLRTSGRGSRARACGAARMRARRVGGQRVGGAASGRGASRWDRGGARREAGWLGRRPAATRA
jgi:hypothetical protein